MSINQPLTDTNGLYNFGGASNIRWGTNPPYAVSDFLTFYPQFGLDVNGNEIVPTPVLEAIIAQANACLLEARWHSSWLPAMGLYVAHYCELWLQASVPAGSVAAVVAEQGKAEGVLADKSVGDVHVGYDTNLSGREAPTGEGWGAFHLTKFGQPFRTEAKLYGMGGCYLP
jgi:hypothetical protein